MLACVHKTYATDRFDHGAAGIDLFVQSAFQADVCRRAVSKLKHIKMTAPQVAVITIEPKPIVFVDSIRSVDSISSFPYNSVSNQVASPLV